MTLQVLTPDKYLSCTVTHNIYIITKDNAVFKNMVKIKKLLHTVGLPIVNESDY